MERKKKQFKWEETKKVNMEWCRYEKRLKFRNIWREKDIGVKEM